MTAIMKTVIPVNRRCLGLYLRLRMPITNAKIIDTIDAVVLIWLMTPTGTAKEVATSTRSMLMSIPWGLTASLENISEIKIFQFIPLLLGEVGFFIYSPLSRSLI